MGGSNDRAAIAGGAVRMTRVFMVFRRREGRAEAPSPFLGRRAREADPSDGRAKGKASLRFSSINFWQIYIMPPSGGR